MVDTPHLDKMQFEFDFDGPFGIGENPALWTPRDIWVRLSQRMMTHFAEDRRIDYKRADRIDLTDLATYLSAFSNTPDGGVLVFGADSKGVATGVSKLDHAQLNKLESCHINMCPLAKPEFKRMPVLIDGKEDFCVAIYIPYVGRLVETSKGEAWVRYGDSRHKMSEEEKRDFRSSRQEHAFELDTAPYDYPAAFDLKIIHDFCSSLRSREESRHSWSNEEILADRMLGKIQNEKFIPYNNLVLLAAKEPRMTIPGCRVRVQRFSEATEGTGANYNPLVDRFIEGNLVKILTEAAEIIENAIFDVTWLNAEGKFVTTKEYPRLAWYEALVNACVHRSYSFSGSEITVKLFPERMEVESPGGFVPPVNENTIYVARATRNHHLMDAMRYLGYVRMAREGTRRIRENMKEWDLPEPEFKQEALHGVIVKVTLMNDHISRRRATDKDVAQYLGVDAWRLLQDYEVKIVAYAYRNQSIQVSEAQRITGRTWATSKKDLEKLVRKNVLRFVAGEYVRDPKAHYVLYDRNSVQSQENR